MRVCIADDIDMNAKLMQKKLRTIHASCDFQVVTCAEDALDHFQDFDLIIIDNSFGFESMTGSVAIQNIRQREAEMAEVTAVIIVLWTAEEIHDAPGADLIWSKAIAAHEMQAQLAPLLNIL